MYVVADDVDAAPPAIAASESTSSGLRMSGMSPSAFRYPAGLPTPTSVPIVSKKSDRKSANTQTIAETTPSFENAWKSKFPKSDQLPQPAMWLQPGHVAVDVPKRLVVGRVVDDRRDDRRADDPDEQVAAEAARAQRERHDDARGCVTKTGHVVQWPSVTGVPCALHDEPGVVEPDERDEEPDADRDRLLQLERDRPHDLLAQAGEHERGHDDALEDDEAHRRREGQAVLADELERDDRVDAETRRERVGVVRVEAHQDRHHRGDDARRRDDAVERQRRCRRAA